MKRILRAGRVLMAAVLACVAVSPVKAQVRARSTQCIPITKEMPSQICRIDTVRTYIHDTTTVVKTDTIWRQGPTITQYRTAEKSKSCWKSVSLCTVGTALLGVGGAVVAYECWVKHKCSNSQTVDVTTLVSADRRNRGRSIGFAFVHPVSLPLRH